MIELKDNGDIDVKKLTPSELSNLVDLRLAYYKAQLTEVR